MGLITVDDLIVPLKHINIVRIYRKVRCYKMFIYFFTDIVNTPVLTIEIYNSWSECLCRDPNPVSYYGHQAVTKMGIIEIIA